MATKLLPFFFTIFLVASTIKGTAGGDTCRVRGRGRLRTFSNDRAVIQLPCEYEMARLECQGYRLRVVASQALSVDVRTNTSSFYYVNSAWFSVGRLIGTTDFTASARINLDNVYRHCQDDTSVPLFNIKEDRFDGAPFVPVVTIDTETCTVHVSVNDSDFRLSFTAFWAGDKEQRRRAGVEIFCPDGDFSNTPPYPGTLCGNDTEVKAIKKRKLAVDVGARSKSVIYDILNNDLVTQTDAQCDVASRVLRGCSADPKTVLQECLPLIHNSRIMSCLYLNQMMNPMQAFTFCLKFRCENNPESCLCLKDALGDCPTFDKLPFAEAMEKCPNMI